MNSEQKIEEILLIVKDIQKQLEKTPSQDNKLLKKEFSEFMLKNFNISWLNDELEENMYDIIFDTVLGLIKKAYPF